MFGLKKGYKIPALSNIEPHKERNNGAARAEMDFVRKETEKLVKKRIVRSVAVYTWLPFGLASVGQVLENRQRRSFQRNESDTQFISTMAES